MRCGCCGWNQLSSVAVSLINPLSDGGRWLIWIPQPCLCLKGDTGFALGWALLGKEEVGEGKELVLMRQLFLGDAVFWPGSMFLSVILFFKAFC